MVQLAVKEQIVVQPDASEQTLVQPSERTVVQPAAREQTVVQPTGPSGAASCQ